MDSPLRPSPAAQHQQHRRQDAAQGPGLEPGPTERCMSPVTTASSRGPKGWEMGAERDYLGKAWRLFAFLATTTNIPVGTS